MNQETLFQEKIDQEKDAIKERIAVKKEEKAEIERKYEELKQQLFQAREKKLGRALTDKEKSEILINVHKTQ